LIHFGTKNTLKSNRNYTPKQVLKFHYDIESLMEVRLKEFFLSRKVKIK
jgi:hypothetical protein